jgi:hypothetical protein
MSQSTLPNSGNILAIDENILFSRNGQSWLNGDDQQAVGQTLETFLANDPNNEVWVIKTTIDANNLLAKYNTNILDFASLGGAFKDNQRFICQTYPQNQIAALETLLATSGKHTTFLTANEEMAAYVASSIDCDHVNTVFGGRNNQDTANDIAKAVTPLLKTKPT